MRLTEVLLGGDVLAARLLYLLLGAALLWVEVRAYGRAGMTPVSEWVRDHVALPLLRVVLLVAFVLMAYPSLLGMAPAPALGEVLFGGDHRLRDLINLTFVIGLLLPLTPVIGRIEALVLPVQGVAAVWLLAVWTATQAGGQGTPWPSAMGVAVVAVIAVIGQWVSTALAGPLGSATDRAWGTEDSAALWNEAVLLAFQPLVIVAIGLDLGRGL